MDKLTNHEMIAHCLLISLFQSPESITRKVNLTFDKHYKVSNVERRLREMFNKDLVVSKIYPNEHSSGTHKRWRVKTPEDTIQANMILLKAKVAYREVCNRFDNVKKAIKGE